MDRDDEGPSRASLFDRRLRLVCLDIAECPDGFVWLEWEYPPVRPLAFERGGIGGGALGRIIVISSMMAVTSGSVDKSLKSSNAYRDCLTASRQSRSARADDPPLEEALDVEEKTHRFC